MGFQGHTPGQRFVCTKFILYTQNLCWRVTSFRAENDVTKPSGKEKKNRVKFVVLGGKNEK